MPTANDHIDVVVVTPTDTDVSLSLATNHGTTPEVFEEHLTAPNMFVFNRQLKIQLLSGELLEVDVQLVFDTSAITNVNSVNDPHATHRALGFTPNSHWTVKSSWHASKATRLKLGITGRLAGTLLDVELVETVPGSETYDIQLVDSRTRSTHVKGTLVLPAPWTRLS